MKIKKIIFKKREIFATPSLPEVTNEQISTCFEYNTCEYNTFCQWINLAYDDIIYWNTNIFSLPPGECSRKVIDLLSFWIDQFNQDTPYSNIAMKVFMILPNLLLQKPSKNSKTQDHIKCLKDRLNKWEMGHFDHIIKECRFIQKKLQSKARTEQSIEKLFARFMLQGKVNSAIRLLGESGSKGVLPMNEENLNTLKSKHPPSSPALSSALLQGPVLDVPSTYYETIDAKMVDMAIKRTKGAPGPSGLDGNFFRKICSKKFLKESRALKENIAKLARKLASEPINPAKLEGYVACRLIPLNKNPGIRPIGIGETLRRIIGKTVSWLVKPEAMEAAGPLQVAAGIKSGSEAAVHAMRELFDDDESEALILVDAKNAFNGMNRYVALHNVRYLCPEISLYLINTYRNPSRLIIKSDGSSKCEIASNEGTTQGDNLGMIFYALGMTPIVRSLSSIIDEENLSLQQCWLADDATAVGKLLDIRRWFDELQMLGLAHGYCVNESKTWVIVKDENHLEQVKGVFKDTKVQFTLEGKRHLGACIGSQNFKDSYCKEKVNTWRAEVEKLCEIAKVHPQAAYSAYIHGFQHKYTYFFRTIAGFEAYLKPLDDLITYGFIPTLFGSAINETERQIFSLPTRWGGLGIHILANKAPHDYTASSCITEPLVSEIKQQGNVIPDQDNTCKITIVKTNQERRYEEKLKYLKLQLTPPSKRALEIAAENGASNWLVTLPLADQGFVLNRSEFTDALNIRYHRQLKRIPDTCPCGKVFNITHGLNCSLGGFIHMRHDNLRDFNAALLRRLHKDVETEPHLIPLPGENSEEDRARVDIRCRGFWRPAQSAYFDVRVTNPLSATALKTTLSKAYDSNEKEKKRKYNYRIMTKDNGTFTPLVYSVAGSLAPECARFYKHLCMKLSEKSDERYSEVLNWVKCKISFMCIRACLMCLRGTRKRNKHSNVYISEDFAYDISQTGLRA